MWWWLCKGPRRVGRWVCVIGPTYFKWEDDPVFEITNEQGKRNIGFQFVSLAGNKAPVDGQPTVENSNPAGLTVENVVWDAAQSIIKFDVRSIDGAGPETGIIHIEGDADLGSGLEPVGLDVAWSVILPKAAGINPVSEGDVFLK